MEDFTEKPYCVVDILPRQVLADSSGQYFAVERYLLAPERAEEIYRRFAGILLKLSCYYELQVSRDPEAGWMSAPEPETLDRLVNESVPDKNGAAEYLYIRVCPEEAVFMLSGDLYMTLYGASDALTELAGQLAGAEGLFLWQPEETNI